MSEFTTDSTIYNSSQNQPFESILKQRFSRRTVLKGSGTLAGLSFLASLGLSGCGNQKKSSIELGFDAIPGSKTDAVTLAQGYTAQILAPWGTPLNQNAEPWASDGTNTAIAQANSVGMHHDGMHFFPIEGSTTEGLLCINHEYIDPIALHPNGPTVQGETQIRTEPEEVRKEINAHGVSVIHVKLQQGNWQVMSNDSFNRRITGSTEIAVSGPIAASQFLKTKFSPNGTLIRGTLNNCGNGYTPWGTYLTCEENWPDYFTNSAELTTDQKRLGVRSKETRYGWEQLAGDQREENDEFSRFNVAPTAADATQDYRNEANGYGYIVEIDPYAPNTPPVKRTALGRFRHEGCWPGKLTEGKPVVFYSGHDAQFEYIYKFVSKKTWNSADTSTFDRMATGASYFDEGTLYVAKFLPDGKGQWLPLTLDSPTLAGKPLSDTYENLAALLINTPGAADAVGATPMDRPEWIAVDPQTGMVYASLTNNTKRTANIGVNPANPRVNNAFGHIIRWTEGSTPTEFEWDMFVFGAPAKGESTVNQSALTPLNQFASPDGLRFDERGILWIQTDNGAEAVANYTNDQMLAVVPSALEPTTSSSVIRAENQAQLRRFFVGPNGCEVTGFAFTPDHKTMFVNVQHPRNWPYSDSATEATPEGTLVRPRAATVVIRKADGTEIGV